ncbi:MAG: copper-binding protein [Roseibium aggregatum]|uniref:copper-binding protein n=1 Tax=uncultured Roseibium sp. TaxID=1936171 RepID=UPI00262D9762|nr:copper-binding protein [uncultured Roseibium sp.]
MKHILTFTLTVFLAVAGATSGFATEYTKGTVKKIDLKGGKITIIHEELKNLDMPAMTMVFATKEDAMLSDLSEGSQIEFIADRVAGKLTVVEIKK